MRVWEHGGSTQVTFWMKPTKLTSRNKIKPSTSNSHICVSLAIVVKVNYSSNLYLVMAPQAIEVKQKIFMQQFDFLYSQICNFFQKRLLNLVRLIMLLMEAKKKISFDGAQTLIWRKTLKSLRHAAALVKLQVSAKLRDIKMIHVCSLFNSEVSQNESHVKLNRQMKRFSLCSSYS